MNSFFVRPIRFAAIALLAASTAIFSASAQEGIQQAMSPEEFRAAGLDKLSQKELANLNSWLQRDREATAKTAETRATKKMDFRVSRIDGTFFGLSGRTIIKLQDGSTWKQANVEDRYQGPGGENLACVVIKAGLFGYRMRIEGTPEFYVDSVK
jgi:hypothetical protein